MIQLDENSRVPIYQQVYDGLLQLIILEVLPENEKIPSVRELALTLNINPNTIQKAYKALEKEGYILSQKGKGNFVAAYDAIMERYKKDLNSRFSIIINDMLSIGQSKDDIMKQVIEIIGESV